MQKLLIVSDIFGQCQGLRQLLQDLAVSECSIRVLDPYQGQPQSFSDEQQAYQAYTECCGHQHYASLVRQTLAEYTDPLALAIGFSAGASALWRALAKPGASKVQQAVLFYPGQIQPYLTFSTGAPVHVIFGGSEPHLDVRAACAALSQLPGVQASSTAWQHGFMNPASKTYSEPAYQQYLELLKALLNGMDRLA
ncbi:dienelactone hydrolase family protein [Alkalimonas mucilaginosa]|uniref:Dienelactone hydrolase family protein n=1 Tax=Alkalimonas mucilaginosa TaxID=3057676 RepID=A0ABU7JGL0_9GAMM|nr:dienelactone hydrolase family protein [Alkalimonas sp. MEB004]MEE2024829.1 dienelactone hydrolase family protein [Alkalimonas sp. MEB004]